MKKFKNLMLMLALALVFVGAMSVTKASAAESVSYINEYVTITGTEGKQVYYQVVKTKDAAATVKATAWIPAAESEGTYYIDFSALSNTKDAYIAYTTDNTATSGTPVEINAVVKSAKVTLNYATEKLAANNLDQIISKVTVKNIDGTEKKDVAPAKYAFLWKRGANGKWAVETEFDQLEWDMVRASNATLYISVAGGDGEADSPSAYAYRPSKEVKVKIPKAAKAPNVKADFTKGTVALKNGMQVRQAGKTDWVTVLPLTKDEKVTETKIFGAANEATKTKVASVAVSTLLDQLKDNGVKAGEEISVEVRTAATDKKFPSAIGTLKFKVPAAGPDFVEGDVVYTYTKADTQGKIKAEFNLDFTKLLEGVEAGKYDAYEYILTDVEDAQKAPVDFSKQKWSKIPANGVVDLKGKIESDATYASTDAEKPTVTFKYVAAKSVLVRKVADKANSLFPSAYSSSSITISEAKVYTITVPTQAPEGVTKISYKVGEGTALKAKKDETVTVTCEVAEGYENLTVTVKNGDATVTGELKDGVYTFKMPEGNVDVTVAVTKKQAAGGETGSTGAGTEGTGTT